jgi:hypothetical protein
MKSLNMKKLVSARKLRRRRCLSVELLEERQLLATITVNTTADEAAADSTLSLREALEVSNGTLPVQSLSTQAQAQVSGVVGNTNTIDFNIPTTDSGYNAATGVWTITLKSALPAIATNAAIVDGYSQPGAAENTLAQGDNAKLAIAINGAGAGTITGLTIGQPGSQVRGLDIENCLYRGVTVTAGGNVQVAGCFIGTNPAGEIAAPNVTGLVIENSSNLIGGPNVGDRNIISGNSQDGLDVLDQAGNPLNIEPTGNLIENNYIGLDAMGTKALGNVVQGVNDAGSGNTYGGTTAGLGNVISGNTTGGIKTGGSVTIEGNFIGTDATGTVALGNSGGFGGIGALQDQGGAPVLSVVITNNVISGNDSYGIYVASSDQKTQATYTIANNLIGTNATGTAALGNALAGINLAQVDNVSVQNNVVSANETGLAIYDSVAVVQGNLIGTDTTGRVPLGNTQGGIYLENSSGNTIGGTGPGQGNVIANNVGIGIEVSGGQQNRISRDSIFGNSEVGIVLDYNVNQAVPAPVLTFKPGVGSMGTLSATLKAEPNLAYTIEIFSDASTTADGQQQGQTFVEDVTVNTDSTGKGSFSIAEPVGYYAVTATDPSGNTSPFSSVVGSQALASTQTTVSSSANPSPAGAPVTFTAVVTAPSYPGTPMGTVTFTIDGQAEPAVALAMVGGSDQAQFTTSTLGAGDHTVTAAYSGDSNVSASSGSLPSQTVSAPVLQTTTTTVTSSQNPSMAGQSVTFTAVVTAPSYPGTPMGTVTFTIDGQAEPAVALAMVGGSDQAQFTTTALGVGDHTVTAAYSGDSNVSASSGSLPSQTVSAPVLQTTTTTLASSLNPSTAGQSVTFTAVVTAPSYSGTPMGTVTFTIDGQAEAPVALAMVGGSDEAEFTTSALGAGDHTVAAAYSGDSYVSASSGSLPNQTVSAPALQTTTTTLTPSLNPSIAGQPVTFTAVVSSSGTTGSPSGTVVFTIDGAALSPVSLQVVSGSDEASVAIASLGVGTHTISAAYMGDPTFAASAVASPLTQTVNAIAAPANDTPQPVPSSASDAPQAAVPAPAVDGPQVVSVKRYGVHAKRTTLVVSFNEALDLASAVNLNNYSLTGPGHHRDRIKSAAFNAVSDTVTLRTAHQLSLHRKYQLTLIGTGPGGIRNPQGALLDGAKTGVSASNYTTTLTRRNAVRP